MAKTPLESLRDVISAAALALALVGTTSSLFATIARLLGRYQGISLGPSAGVDTAAASLPHFQPFERGALELHADGTIYVSVTPPVGPTWYDVNRAEDAEESQDMPIRAAGGPRRFSELKQANVEEARWDPPNRALPPSRGPAPRWLAIRLPLPCAADRAQLAALETRLRAPAPSQGVVAKVRRWIQRREAQRLAHRLVGPTCRPKGAAGWAAVLRSAPRADVEQLVPRAAPPLSNSGDYCFRDVVSKLDPILGIPGLTTNSGPPEWQTILPANTPRDGEAQENGQRLYDPDHPLRSAGNHYVGWDELRRLMQTDSDRARRIVRWTGHPTREDIKDRPIPWLPSAVDGIVTNSFLSGSDYAGDHADAPDGYWLGVSSPHALEGCGTLEAVHALCDDWVVFVRPDPEYRFLLAQDSAREAGTDAGLGNFTSELQGNLENEVEQWLIPVGFRPEPGDRIHLTGRWTVDCGHEDWHAELHPIESFVSAHAARNARALSQAEVAASLVVTGDWAGGELDLDVWPPVRPSAAAALQWRRDGGMGVVQGLTVVESLEPADNPNHLHLRVISNDPWQPLTTYDWNEVEPHPTRRVATKYHVWWR